MQGRGAFASYELVLEAMAKMPAFGSKLRRMTNEVDAVVRTLEVSCRKHDECMAHLATHVDKMPVWARKSLFQDLVKKVGDPQARRLWADVRSRSCCHTPPDVVDVE